MLLPALILVLGFTPADAPTTSKVDFERHVMGIFGRMGCNAGSCHGSFQGRGGFRLSLFGHDPEKDYQALTREGLARRVNLVEPDRSLLLLKATAQIEHGGGKRFDKDSWQYRMLHDWITGGTPRHRGSGEITSIAVQPPDVELSKTNETKTVVVSARFADGTSEDITRYCDFRTNDDSVAEVAPNGHILAGRPGDTSVVVSYRGNVVPIRVYFPTTLPTGFEFPPAQGNNYIDGLVYQKLRRLNIAPSPLAGDAEFLRRVTVDTIGSLPSPDEVRAFLADGDPDKRSKMIDSLLAHPLHAALWATKLCDITGNNTDALENPRPIQPKRSQMWHDWLRKRLTENQPYDRIVHDILTATSRDGQPATAWLANVRKLDDAAQAGYVNDYAVKPTLDLFWRRQANVPPEQWGEKTAAAFMGVRLECAQCHKHPFDRWSQQDYLAYANVFGQVTFGISPEAKPLIDEENNARKAKTPQANQAVQVREVFLNARPRTLTDPDTRKVLQPKALGGPEIAVSNGQDAREALFTWLRKPENPYFARSFVNRVWGHYFGVGIVDPVDDFSQANPPSNPELLDALAKDFVEHGYDIRHLESAILRSRTYQLTASSNETNRLDRKNYSHAYVRPLMAEIVLDMLNSALGVEENFGPDAPPHSRAVEVGSSRVQNANLAYAFRIFGRPARAAACDCDRSMGPALPQTLYRMTDATLLAKLQNGRLAQLLGSNRKDDELLEDLFLATLTRLPRENEKQAFLSHLAAKGNRKAALTDTLWALINTREFVLNH